MSEPGRGPGRWGGLAIVALLATVFAFLNGGNRVTIDAGFVVLYRLPLVVVVFAAFILGMVTMFLLGLRHDLRVRRYLREQRADEEPFAAWRPDPPPDDDYP